MSLPSTSDFQKAARSLGTRFTSWLPAKESLLKTISQVSSAVRNAFAHLSGTTSSFVKSALRTVSNLSAQVMNTAKTEVVPFLSSNKKVLGTSVLVSVLCIGLAFLARQQPKNLV